MPISQYSDHQDGVMLCRRGLLRTTVFVLLAAPAAVCAQDAVVYDMAVRRDPGCPCCHLWVALMEETGRFRPTMTDEADMAGLKQSLGVPADLASCHTAVVEGLVFEGHVPAADMFRLLAERPAGVLGLAVPGMPLGSPGMETPDGRTQPYTVFAFKADGTRDAFASYGA